VYCNKNSFITSIDYSENLKYLKISTSKNELFYYDFEKNEFIYVISLIKDIKWFYNNSPFSWFTKGFFILLILFLKILLIIIYLFIYLLLYAYS
jgi:hypothetical protein